jgi:hypothetical protein
MGAAKWYIVGSKNAGTEMVRCVMARNLQSGLLGGRQGKQVVRI